MEETKDQAPGMSPVEPEEDVEINHTDKLVGVFSEPGKTFASIAKSGAVSSDWIIPIITLIAVSILSIIVLFSNPAIKMQMKQQRDKQMQELVDQGRITQEQADQQIENSEKFFSGPFMIITGAISSTILIFIQFFIVSGAFFFAVKFGLKGEGTYKDAMTAYGLPQYIIIIQVIVMVILSLSLGRAFQSTSVAAFMNPEKSTIVTFLLGKLDIFSIWFYAVLSIAFAKMFKSQDTVKYFITIFAIWLGFGLIFFYIGKAVPFLSFLSR